MNQSTNSCSYSDKLASRARFKCILVRRETSPEDIRGMHAAQAILTERGGMTSHAAVIARGQESTICAATAAYQRSRANIELFGSG